MYGIFCSYIYYLLLHWFQQELCLSFYVRNFLTCVWFLLTNFQLRGHLWHFMTCVRYYLLQRETETEKKRNKRVRGKESKKIKSKMIKKKSQLIFQPVTSICRNTIWFFFALYSRAGSLWQVLNLKNHFSHSVYIPLSSTYLLQTVFSFSF